MRTLISRRVRVLAGLLAVGATACSSSCSDGSTSAPVADAAPSASAAVVRPDASPFAMPHRGDAGEAPIDPLCATVLKEEHLEPSALHSEDHAMPGPRLFCAASPTLAWAVRVDPPDDGGHSVRQTLIFSGADGKRARLESTLDNVEWPPALGRHAAMFDFDGDGVPEFFAVVPKDVRTFAPAVRNLVTYKNGKISPYPTGGNFLVDGVADLDGDGRGDLRVSIDLGKRTVCDAGEDSELTLEFAAHGLPGGKFSLSDAAAAAYAAKKCPSMPAADTLFVPSMDRTHDARDLSLSYVACSRMRGKSADAMVAELQAACAAHADAAKTCGGPCRHLPDALAIAKFVPPVQAKDPPSTDAGANKPQVRDGG